MAAGRIYWLGRFLGTACIFVATLFPQVVFIFLCSGCFFPGRLQRRGGYGRLDF